MFWWLHDDRGAAAAAAFATAALRAVFVDGVPLADTAALERFCAAQGLDADAAEHVWQDATWKARLKQENDAAIAASRPATSS